ncbi:non-ribosomal peptide synthetase [Streptosporangium vulgare]|uniref:Amino acid adenylation domain-containing protein n=1 Tax=Streptosporangium vulgare TaxID=46190 RepID=A0ABV5T9Z7_9ACTN
METTNSSLPLARPAGDDRTGAPHRHSVSVPEKAVQHRETFAVAALAGLLHRYTGETDLLIGRRAGQGAAETVRLRVSGDTTAADLLAGIAATRAEPSTGETCHAVVSTGDVPGVPGTPVVPGISAGDVPASAAPADGVSASGVSANGGEPGPRAALTVLTRDEGDFELVMSRAEFDADAAAQYALHLGRVLDALAADRSVALRDIPLLTEEESRRILVDWNQTDEPVPDLFFHEVVADIARRTPDVVAVAWPGGRMTFRELDDQANRLAHRLASTGVRPRDRVGVCFPRGAESLIAQLACFKTGAAAILLDPEFPDDRVRFMIEDASAVVVLTTKAHEPKVSGICPVLSLDDADWRDEPATPVGERVEAGDLIHICYTSGSTGVPKAVMVPHGAARNLIYSMRVICGITEKSRGTWLAAPGYGMVEVECFSVLAAGATVHIPEPSVVTSPEWLRDWLVSERITHTLLMKAMAERLWTLHWPAETELVNIRICGERVQSWPSADLPFHVFNLYGSAEATVVATCDITQLGVDLGEEGRAHRLPPIGRPTPNVKAYVLGENLEVLPPGVVGEIFVAGESLSEGYLGRPEATAEKWLANPMDPVRHPVLYRTGDVARYWTDGSIEIVGRTDNQIKVRGNRVHLGEIEAVLADQPGVGQAAVLAKKDGQGDVQLVAYIEPGPGPVPEVRDVRAALRQTLPSFMVPAAYVIGGLPTTTNGKIDRTALPEPPRSRPEVGSPYQEPRDDVERSLQRIWAKTLELEGIGILDNFFELGGDSLRAARLTERIREVFDVDVDIDDLFDDASIERMAHTVAEARRS